MGVAWDTLLDGNVRTLIERDLLAGFLQRQRWFGGKARGIRVGAVRRLGTAPARRASALPDDRRSGVPGRRARQLLPAAGDLRGRRREDGRRAMAAGGARAGHRRTQGRAVRRLARQRLRPRHARIDRAVTGSADAPRNGSGGADRRVRRTAGRRPARHQPPGRRAEQHVAGLRRSLHPQAVPAPAAGHQPRLRDRAAVDRTGGLHPRSGRRRSLRAPA